MAGSTALTDVIASHFPEDFDWVGDIQEDILMELARSRLGPRYDFDILRERMFSRTPAIPKRMVPQTQYRMANRLVQALNRASKAVDYNRASQLLADLERNIDMYGQHLFEDIDRTTSFIDSVRQAISRRERVNIILGGKDGYTIRPHQPPRTAASPSVSETNGDGHPKQPYVNIHPYHR